MSHDGHTLRTALRCALPSPDLGDALVLPAHRVLVAREDEQRVVVAQHHRVARRVRGRRSELSAI